MFRLHATPTYIGPLPSIKARPQRAKRVVTKPVPFEEVRGVHVTTYADRIVVSNGIYSTYRYRERLIAAGATWNGQAWTLPAGTDVRAVLDPHGSIAAAVAAANRPSWTCCPDAHILSHKNKHYSCAKHTMYWEECMGADGQPIKILYAASTKGGGCYTGN